MAAVAVDEPRIFAVDVERLADASVAEQGERRILLVDEWIAARGPLILEAKDDGGDAGGRGPGPRARQGCRRAPPADWDRGEAATDRDAGPKIQRPGRAR